MVNMNIMTEEMKKELAFTEEELKELEQFYQFPKPFYQLSKFLNFDTKIRGKKTFTNQRSGKLKCGYRSNQHKSRASAKSSQSRWGLCNIAKLNLIGKVEELQRDLRLFFLLGHGPVLH